MAGFTNVQPSVSQLIGQRDLAIATFVGPEVFYSQLDGDGSRENALGRFHGSRYLQIRHPLPSILCLDNFGDRQGGRSSSPIPPEIRGAGGLVRPDYLSMIFGAEDGLKGPFGFLKVFRNSNGYDRSIRSRYPAVFGAPFQWQGQLSVGQNLPVAAGPHNAFGAAG